MSIIYYVGATVAPESQFRLWHHFGSIAKHPHVTLAYSRKWFPYKPAKFFPLVIEPPYKFEDLGELKVLSISSQRLFERHIELRNAGAEWDFDQFRAHITLGIIGAPLPDFPIILSSENYQTWEEE